MKLFPQWNLNEAHLIYTYRLSKAKRVVENAFGSVVNRFGVRGRTMHLSPERATTVSKACVALHNILRNYFFHLLP